MSVTFGFYNSRNGDRVYNAQQMSSIFSGIIKDGVFEHFPAQNQHLHVDWLEGQVGDKVVVGPGRAWLNNTWTDNSTDLIIQLDEPNQDQNIERIDAIVLEINTTNSSDSAPNMSEAVPGRTNKFVVIKGTEASPENVRKPPLRNGNGIYQYYIALVRVAANAEHHYITNMVGANDGTPYIIGAVQSVSTADVLQAWTQAFNAAIDQFRVNSTAAINAACDRYFNDPNSQIYQNIQDLSDAFYARMDEQEAAVTDMSNRKHIWIIDQAVSSVANNAVTYSKSDQGGANTPHNIYPDFFNGGQVTDGTCPKVGDVIIGKNGYYALVTHWSQYSGGYSMIIKSTGKNVINNAFKIYFGGGHYLNGVVDSSPASCTKTFAEIKAAYEAGMRIEAFLEFGEQVHTSGHEGYWQATDLAGTIEYVLREDVLEEVVVSLLYYYDAGHLLKHEYTIDRYGVANRVTTIV